MLSKHFKLTTVIQLFSLAKIPLLGLCRPKVIHLDENRSIVRLPLNPLTRNHVQSMYFGALAMGSELSVALKVVERMFIEKAPVNFIFKDFQCEFLKRAETAVDFCFLDVAAVSALVDETLRTQERVSRTFSGFAVNACADGHESQEKLMTYKITISIKARSK